MSKYKFSFTNKEISFKGGSMTLFFYVKHFYKINNQKVFNNENLYSI
jgi:hypothetical protein